MENIKHNHVLSPKFNMIIKIIDTAIIFKLNETHLHKKISIIYYSLSHIKPPLIVGNINYMKT